MDDKGNRRYSDPVATTWSISFQPIEETNCSYENGVFVILYRPRWSGLAFLKMGSDDFPEEIIKLFSSS